MSPRGEQGTGVIIARVAEECEGDDYGKKNGLNPASLLRMQLLDCIRMMSFVPGFVFNDICLLSLVVRTDLCSKENMVFSLHIHSTFPILSQFLHCMDWFLLTSISTAFLFLSLLDSPQKLRCPIPHSPSTPNFLLFYLFLSLSAYSLRSPHLPSCSNLTYLFFLPFQSSAVTI